MNNELDINTISGLSEAEAAQRLKTEGYMEIKCFTKNVKGYNSYLKEDNFDFKSENEWRFVPRKNEIGNNLISQKRSTYLKNPEKHNNKLLPYPLRFNKSDIEYIFVSKQEEANKISQAFSININKVLVSRWKTK